MGGDGGGGPHSETRHHANTLRLVGKATSGGRSTHTLTGAPKPPVNRALTRWFLLWRTLFWTRDRPGKHE